MNEFDRGYLAGSSNEKLITNKKLEEFLHELVECDEKGRDLFTYNFIEKKLLIKFNIIKQ